mmetsp:Transcript_114264/g.262188  ORF Transcript_114264/g.262188 Transcript_114264/m.262188 type:complete len:87 (+) Transcript_114264:334-594(+)
MLSFFMATLLDIVFLFPFVMKDCQFFCFATASSDFSFCLNFDFSIFTFNLFLVLSACESVGKTLRLSGILNFFSLSLLCWPAASSS